MSVIRRGLLALILVAPLALGASVASAPSSSADANCSSGASVGQGAVQTYVCLTIDHAPAKAQPLTATSSGQPLVCWLEPQYTPAQLDSLITYESGLPIGVVGSEGGQYYQILKTNYGGLTPPYRDGESGWWWGVGCDISNTNANTYMENLWAAVGLDVYHPWEWVPNENTPTGPPNQVTTPAMLTLYAREAAPLDKPSGEMSPAYTGGTSTQTVGLPTYFWGQIGQGTTPVTRHEITATVQWLSSPTVTAVPISVTVKTTGKVKGSSSIDCPVTNGLFGSPDASNATITSDCSFTYTEPSNNVSITMVTHWKVSWPAEPGVAAGTVYQDSNIVTFGGINVQEVQTINNG